MSDPERDRILAARQRTGWRRAEPLAEAVGDFRASPEFAALRRFTRVNSALKAALPANAQGKVRAVAMQSGTLTLEVADGVLLAELRSTCARRIVEALAAGGTGATRLIWRVARRT